jgi:peptidoglycan hydrolase-like protein with peptidoglycan-binding domain/nucleoid-associated protein YgaU
MAFGADALDSRDDDWTVNEFDGQTHFSDDGQLYQPVDPNVYTGNSDAVFVPASGALVRTSQTTLEGDLPGYFDYLRMPGVAEEFHPRDGLGEGSSDDLRPVIGFENPWEPFPKGNARRRRGIKARFDRTVSFGDDAQGMRSSVRSDAGDIYTDIGTWHVQTLEAIRKNGGRINASQNQRLLDAFHGIQSNAKSGQAWATVQGADETTLAILREIWNGRPPQALVNQLHTHFVNISKAMPGPPGGLSKIASTIGSAVGGIARPIGGLITSPAHLVSDLAHGKNVLSAIKDTVKRDLGNVGAVAPYAQAVLSVVPGVGQGVNAAIAAGSALAHGQNITDALVNGVKAMVPGGPLAQQALDSAYKIAKGGNVIASVAEAARNNLPGGELAKRAFDTGLALAHGANLQKTLVQQGTDLAKGQAMTFFSDEISKLSPIAQRVTGQNAPQFIGDVIEHASSLVPSQMTTVAKALLKNPALRSLPIDQLAQRLNVAPQTARDAVASLISTVSRAGGPSIPHMAPAIELARRIGTNMNFDQALSHFASHMAPIAGSPNVRRARPLAMHWFRTAQGFTPHIGDAMGLDPTGTAYIVESGDSMSKISAKLVGTSSRVGELIKANPQVKDPNKIFVGQRLNLPASWMAKPVTATAPPPLTTTVSPMSAPAPMPTLPAPMAAATPILASSMPTLSQKAGSSGAAVRAWQNILIRDNVAPPGTADGVFGPNTTSRTKQWQSSHGLGADGVVGPKTWAVALATLPSVVVGAPATSAPALPASIQTPLGNLPIPGIFQPTSTTIAENPAAPIAAPIPAALPALPPALATPMAIPPIGTVIGTTPVPSVTATQTGPSEVTVTQPPIGPEPSGKPGLGGLGAMALALGALYVVGKGKLGL